MTSEPITMPQKNSTCLTLLLHLLVSTSSAYFAGPNTMSWVDAKRYCENRSTTLASMHSEQDFLDIQQTCIAIGTDDDCWIGLDYQNDKYIYLDNTTLDYGFNTDGSPATGQYPWKGNQPDDDPTDHCIQLESHVDFLLIDDLCADEELPLCNDVPYSSDLTNNTSLYWLSENRLSWTDASIFCQSYCQSELASIHSYDDYNTILELINNSHPITQGYDSKNIWIGLNDLDLNGSWTWDDDTLFTFGVDVSGGEYPWDSQAPHGGYEGCVRLRESSNYKWDDKECNDKFRFLCNSCEGKLDKYLLYSWSTPKTWTEASLFCEQELNTSLASIHNEDDHELSVLLAQLDVSSIDTIDTWIGLNRLENEGVLEWSDNTPFDFGSDTSGDGHPWRDGQPTWKDGNNCVEINELWNYAWNDDECSDGESRKYLCYKPNEFCYEYNWYKFGNISFDACQIMMHDEGISVMSNKRWTDNNNPLIIEYVFSVDEVNDFDDNEVGIVMVEQENICHHIFIGFTIDTSLDLSVKYNKENIMTLNDLNQQMALRRYYRLKLQMSLISDMILCEVFLDDALSATVNITKNVNNAYRYIGVKNKNIKTMGKSLFVSGTPEYLNNDVLYEECSTTTTVPTDSTTAVPAVSGATIQDEPNEKNAAFLSMINDYLWMIILSATILLCVCITIIIIRTVKRKQKIESTSHEENLGKNAAGNECIGGDIIEFAAKPGDDKQVLKVVVASDAPLVPPPVPKSLDIPSRDTPKDDDDPDSDEDDDTPTNSELMYVNNKNEIDVFARANTEDMMALIDEEEENDNENEDERGNKDAAEGKADEEIRDWLAGFGLDEYTNNFIKNGFDSLKFVKAIKGMDNLKQIGIKLLGHRVLIMEEINRLDVNAKKEFTKSDEDKTENGDGIVTTTTITEGGYNTVTQSEMNSKKAKSFDTNR